MLLVGVILMAQPEQRALSPFSSTVSQPSPPPPCLQWCASDEHVARLVRTLFQQKSLHLLVDLSVGKCV